MQTSPIKQRNSCSIKWLGLIDYARAFDEQIRLVDALKKDRTQTQHLLLCEHPPVYTMGRMARDDNILAPPAEIRKRGASIVETNRGGDITFHGPGQLVGYPILNLERNCKDVGKYLRKIESVIIKTLATYSITGARDPKYTGVWVGNNKICAIGVAISRWVSYHGFAFNITTDLSYFDLINPCGITGKGVTSLSRQLGRPVDMHEVIDRLTGFFLKEFGLSEVAL